MWRNQQSRGPDGVEPKELSNNLDHLNTKNSPSTGNWRLGGQDDENPNFRWKNKAPRNTGNGETGGKWLNDKYKQNSIHTISNTGQQTILREPRGPVNEGNWAANRVRRNEDENTNLISSIVQDQKGRRTFGSSEPRVSRDINQTIPYRKSHFKPYFSITKWLKMTQKNPEEIMIDITQHMDEFKKFFSTNLTTKEIISFINIFSTMCKSFFISNLASALVFIISTKFIKQVENTVLQLPITFATDANLNIDEFFINLNTFCSKIAELIPSSAADVLPQLLKTITYTIPNFEKTAGESINDKTKTAIESLHASLTDMLERKKNIRKKEKRHEFDHEDGEAPDDFRSIPIFPTAEEITTNKEVFLRHNKITGNYQNADHYLDVQFRLMREDFVAPLREGVCNYLTQPKDQYHRQTSIKVYKDVYMLGQEVTRNQLCTRIQFMQPGRRTKQKMQQSKLFMFGTLLCFTSDDFKTIIFGSVQNSDIEYLEKGQLVVGFDTDKHLLENYAYVMVESKVYFEPYKNVLRAMQCADLTNFNLCNYFISINDVKDYVLSPKYLRGIIPSYSSEGLNPSQRDAYNEGLTKEVSVIQGPPGTGKTFLGLKMVQTLLENRNLWLHKGPMLVVCMTNHALDQFLEGMLEFTDSIVRIGGQSKNKALVNYNLRAVKFQQSKAVSAYIWGKKIKVEQQAEILLFLTEKMNMITLYTGVINFQFFKNVLHNYEQTWFYHASDSQLIEWLLEEFNWNYVPFGSQFHLQQPHQSQSETLDIYKNVQKHLEEQQYNRYGLEMDDNIFSSLVVTDDSLINLHNLKQSIFNLSDENDKLNPDCSQYLENQFKLDNYNAKYEYILSKLEMLKHSDEKCLPQIVDLYNPFRMPVDDRWLFYNYLLHLCKPTVREQIGLADQKYRRCCDEYNGAKEISDINVMRSRQVIGMTTTGAARLQTALQAVHSPIVIVEEAAEVLESHILTALSSKCEHLILIGDHKQLRPSTADYTIERNYLLGISLFERYISNGFPFNQLNVQHRMRSEIAGLLTPTIYETLHNHPSVYDKPKPPGIMKPLYFITHKHQETSTNDTTKENRHEATYFLELARYLVLNGIEPEKITILAAYAGQLFLLLKKRIQYPELENTVIVVLDNYQGEENDIILLSLVRNNDDDSIGFLALENRICVALSRAKNGMYIMGNIDLLSSRSKTWPKIKVKLEEIDSIGTALELCCQKHPHQITLIKNIEDFNKVPEGGCMQLCNEWLECGHNCVLQCHPRDHIDLLCNQQCLKELCEFGHRCPRRCHEPCGKCLVSKNCILKCGHALDIPCHKNPDEVVCKYVVSAELPCGHISNKKCFEDPNDAQCLHKCEQKFEFCGHSCILDCHIKDDPEHIKYKCQKQCEKRNKGCSSPEDPTHMCQRKCSEECSPCDILVQKHRSVCKHVYRVACSQNVDELFCTKPCKKTLNCGHECQKECSKPCDGCEVEVNKVITECGHKIKTKCSIEPTRSLCKANCIQILPCGHKCKQKCSTQCDQSKCTELSATIMSVCGHEVVIPCNVHLNQNDEVISSYCEEKCTKTLECGHICGGTCSECFQGRMHKICVESCNRILACGHKCSIKCNQPCQPCQSNCTYRCAHNKCKKKCGAPCTLCSKECKRKCQHQACSKLCHEKCDVPPCMEACTEKLNCGHDCIGYCGDPCPPKCRICDKDEVENNPDIKYVILEDCKHIFNSTHLEKLFTVQNGFIWLAQCPKCSTDIIKTQRYHDYVKTAYENIQQVKIQHHGRPEKVEADRKTLLARAKKLSLEVSSLGTVAEQICKSYIQMLEPIKNNRNQQADKQFQLIYSSKFILFEKLTLKILNNNGLLQFHVTKKIIDNLLLWINKQSEFITNEEILNYKSELTRLSHAVQLFKIADKINCNSEEYLDCINRLLSFDPYSDEFAYKSELYLRTLSGENLIEEMYLDELPNAIDFSKEFWIKCKDEHVFVRTGDRIVCSMCEQSDNLVDIKISALDVIYLTDQFEGLFDSDTESD